MRCFQLRCPGEFDDETRERLRRINALRRRIAGPLQVLSERGSAAETAREQAAAMDLKRLRALVCFGEDWDSGVLDEYASQAALAADDTLMINPIDNSPVNHGGSFRFHKGQTIARIPFDKEDILIADV